MNAKKILGIGCLLAVTMIGLSSASAAGKAKKAATGNSAHRGRRRSSPAQYTEMLTALQAEIAKAVPAW